MLAILTTHPIQYQVPLWQALAKDGRVPFEVWYLTSHATKKSHDVEFGKEFAWDLDMLKGYPHRFLEVARGATPNSFWKCRLKEKLRDRLRESGARALWIQGWQVAAYWQAVREAKAAGVEVWLRGESNDLRAETTRPRDHRTTGPRTTGQRDDRTRGQQDNRTTGRWSGGPKSWAKRLLLEQLFRRVDRFLYIGSANKRLYQKFGVPDNKLFPAPYAVDNARFAAQASELRAKRQEVSGSQGANFTAGGTESLSVSREAGDSVSVETGRSVVRSQWGIAEDAFVILFCGKFIPKKRPLDLIAAVSSLVTRHSSLKLHLLFVGSGELGDAMRAACRVVFDAESGPRDDETTGPRSSGQWSVVSGRSPTASFAGFLNQTEVSRAYVAADVLILPSDYEETWGLVVNEAMASGLPCIVSNRCGCAEDLVPSALRFPAGDVDALAETIRRFMASPRDSHDSMALPTFMTTVETVAHLFSKTPESTGKSKK